MGVLSHRPFILIHPVIRSSCDKQLIGPELYWNKYTMAMQCVAHGLVKSSLASCKTKFHTDNDRPVWDR